VAKLGWMEGPPRRPRAERYVERRIARHGLRPRVAAGIIAVLWLTAIAIFGVIEHLVDPESFDNVWLGMWWATQTVTTVGYGDVVPDEAAGQLIASILMIGGLSFFAVITGMITSVFIARAQEVRRSSLSDPVIARLEEISGELEAIRQELGRSPGSGAADEPPADGP
jgi:voltage-gated potassium channel